MSSINEKRPKLKSEHFDHSCFDTNCISSDDSLFSLETLTQGKKALINYSFVKTEGALVYMMHARMGRKGYLLIASRKMGIFVVKTKIDSFTKALIF